MQQWLNTLRDYAFPKIGRMPVDVIGQPEVLMCLSPIWTEKHETAKRLAQRIKAVLDVAKASGFREGENPVKAVKEPTTRLDPITQRETLAMLARIADNDQIAIVLVTHD